MTSHNRVEQLTDTRRAGPEHIQLALLCEPPWVVWRLCGGSDGGGSDSGGSDSRCVRCNGGS